MQRACLIDILTAIAKPICNHVIDNYHVDMWLLSKIAHSHDAVLRRKKFLASIILARLW